jgi:hypothetical protein
MTTATANRLKVLPVSDQLRIRLAISRPGTVGIKAIAEFLQTQLLLSVRRSAAQVSDDRSPEALEHGR